MPHSATFHLSTSYFDDVMSTFYEEIWALWDISV